MSSEMMDSNKDLTARRQAKDKSKVFWGFSSIMHSSFKAHIKGLNVRYNFLIWMALKHTHTHTHIHNTHGWIFFSFVSCSQTLLTHFVLSVSTHRHTLYIHLALSIVFGLFPWGLLMCSCARWPGASHFPCCHHASWKILLFPHMRQNYSSDVWSCSLTWKACHSIGSNYS